MWRARGFLHEIQFLCLSSTPMVFGWESLVGWGIFSNAFGGLRRSRLSFVWEEKSWLPFPCASKEQNIFNFSWAFSFWVCETRSIDEMKRFNGWFSISYFWKWTVRQCFCFHECHTQSVDVSEPEAPRMKLMNVDFPAPVFPTNKIMVSLRFTSGPVVSAKPGVSQNIHGWRKGKEEGGGLGADMILVWVRRKGRAKRETKTNQLVFESPEALNRHCLRNAMVVPFRRIRQSYRYLKRTN